MPIWARGWRRAPNPVKPVPSFRTLKPTTGPSSSGLLAERSLGSRAAGCSTIRSSRLTVPSWTSSIAMPRFSTAVTGWSLSTATTPRPSECSRDSRARLTLPCERRRWYRARAARKAGNADEALAAYAELEQLADVLVEGRPVPLLGAHASCTVLEHEGRREELAAHAARFREALYSGRWLVPRALFDVRRRRGALGGGVPGCLRWCDRGRQTPAADRCRGLAPDRTRCRTGSEFVRTARFRKQHRCGAAGLASDRRDRCSAGGTPGLACRTVSGSRSRAGPAASPARPVGPGGRDHPGRSACARHARGHPRCRADRSAVDRPRGPVGAPGHRLQRATPPPRRSGRHRSLRPDSGRRKLPGRTRRRPRDGGGAHAV